MSFDDELQFEDALVKLLTESYGWSPKVLNHPKEEDLIRNWAEILYQNNRSVDRLNNCPLTEGEMRQILEQITVELRTPLRINAWITGQTITIKRDHPEDKEHLGKEVSLKIFDGLEIAGGQSVYQIARQPYFETPSGVGSNRRGDLLLLINGMPLFHIELKKSSVPLNQACNQIEKYAREGVYHGIYTLVQLFVAMTPEETVYFANPGPEGKFNPNFYFHWADYNNEPMNDWRAIAKHLLSIPMAHQLIGLYMIADGTDGVLKVMRSYQYYAAAAISDAVAKTKWSEGHQLGGFIWHTTGSGKTMTSFKSAQLIAASKDADKVIFLVDRVELGTQSLAAYQNFASGQEEVQGTESTDVLVAKLKSANPSDTLIVTSIQKMSNIKAEEHGLTARDVEKMRSKRLVFIIDECHRSTFGEMLLVIKQTFPKAVFFGFTGTPIQEENQKKHNTTSTIFGNELHRYSIADGIRDGNVLGFDPYKVLTFKDEDLRKAVALEKAKATTVEEAMLDDEKREVFLSYQNLPMEKDYVGGHGIEYYIKDLQYRDARHQTAVVEDILEHWAVISRGGKFHAIFATSSIQEAIEYYRWFKEMAPQLKVTALFDPSIDNRGETEFKEEGLIEIIEDYNRRYHQSYTMATWHRMKKDIANRLAHKGSYKAVEKIPDEQLDLLIVVDQMLTGFDSKWINTLYLDKLMQFENIIQAFSRTNRLFGNEKPFGTIKYYRYPHTMEKYIEAAVKLYSGDRPLKLFVDRLPQNIMNLNQIFAQINDLFQGEQIENFSSLPAEPAVKQKFASLFRDFNRTLSAAMIQGFSWEMAKDVVEEGKTPPIPQCESMPTDDIDYNDAELCPLASSTTVDFDELTFVALQQRYQELGRTPGRRNKELPYNIDTHLTTIATAKIDADYMDANFKKYLKLLTIEGVGAESVKQAEVELHRSFATLSQEEQKYANLFLHDIQRGDVEPLPGRTLQDYIAEYIARAKDDRIHRFAVCFGLDEARLRQMLEQSITEANINAFGRYQALKNTADKVKMRAYFEKSTGKTILPYKLAPLFDEVLRTFLLSGGEEELPPLPNTPSFSENCYYPPTKKEE